jgi:hypothetical protein
VNKFLAHLISWVFHPLLMPTYALLLMLAANPFVFGVHSFSEKRSMVLLISVFFTTALIPGIAIALMKLLGFVKTVQMEDRQDRTGPYIATGVFYLWLFKNIVSSAQVPPMYSQFILGATIGLFLAFIINIFAKISAHAVGVGGLVALVIVMAVRWPGFGASIPVGADYYWLSPNVVLATTVFIAGMTGTARLALKAHVPVDVYRGYAAGALAVLISCQF